MIGTVLDKYEVLQKLGEGGMATVFRGRHLTLGRDVAIKILHPHLSAAERHRQRFAREARAIEHMDHENILTIFDYSGSETQECYIVTEFVDGVTLRELLSERGRLPSEVAATIALSLADALAYAHSMGIIHRDLKPENVMLRRDGVVKLMDFGIAHFLDEVHLTVTGALVGSPAYMSPEQAMERPLDARSDLFSLGTLLFHLVSGQLPFSGSNPSVILRNIIDGTRPQVMELVPDIDGAFADVIEQLLQTDPDDRPHTASLVRDTLRQILQKADLDVQTDRWSLRAWQLSPDAYELQLREHLARTLLERGREHLEARDHLEALRLFNRLLSIDEDNEEVLSLIQGMHSLHPDDHNDNTVIVQSRRRWWAAALTLPALAGALVFLLWPDPSSPETAPDALAALDFPTSPLDPPPPDGPPRDDTTPEASDGGEGEPGANEGRAGAPESLTAATAREPGTRKGPGTGLSVSPSLTRVRISPQAASPRLSDPPVLPPVVTEKATVHIVPLESWAEIRIDGESRGRIRQMATYQLTPGTHQIRAENSYSRPYEYEFTVGAGEERQLEIKLEPLPVDVGLPAETDPACRVLLEGRSLGTAGALGYHFSLETPHPGKTYQIELDCPSQPLRSCPLKSLRFGETVWLDCP